MPFLIVVVIIAVGLPTAVNFAFESGWLPGVPGFLYETTWLVAFVTTVIYLYLYRSGGSAYFVQLYLSSVVIKLLMYLAYCAIMIFKDRPGSVMNVLYFFVLYFLFTAVEIAFLHRRISRGQGP